MSTGASPALLILAAGIGSRYGGLKQIDPVGPSGEMVIDYAIYDAIRAGFSKVIFVIRKDIEADFRAVVGNRFEGRMEVHYQFQELNALPAGFTCPPERQKPWGTGHAILCAEESVAEPFAVINADDFYGQRSFALLHDFLVDPQQSSPTAYALVGFALRRTLSEHGHVARGVCQCSDAGMLESVIELTNIQKHDGQVHHTDPDGSITELSGDEYVSMNMWGFDPSIFIHLQSQFEEFLRDHAGVEKTEFYIPAVVDRLIKNEQVTCSVLPTPDTWFGVTYKQDKASVIEKINGLVAAGSYPADLWGVPS